jgi:hypothetical protein
MGIVLTIFLSLVGIVVLFILVLICSPFHAGVSAGYRKYAFTGSALLSFIHPKIISVKVDITKKSFKITLFGWTLKKKKTKQGASEAETPQEEPQPSEPAAQTVPEEPEETSTEADAEPPEPIKPPLEESLEAGEPEADTLRLDEQEDIDHTELETKVIQVSALGGEEPEAVVRSFPPNEPAQQKQSADQAEEKSVEPADIPSAEPEPAQVRAHGQEERSEAEKEKVAPQAPKKDNWFIRLDRNRYWFFLRNHSWRSKVIRWIFRFLRTLLRIVRFDRLQLDICAGIRDPATVGVVNGWYRGLFYGLPMRKPYIVKFRPVFMKNHFEGTVSLRIGTSIIRLLMPVVMALVTLPWVHTLWLVYKYVRRERAFKRLAAAE